MREGITFSLAYIAGFFDGEGSIGIYTNGQKCGHCLLVQVCQNDSLLTRELFNYLAFTYSCKYTEQVTTSGNVKLNLQLSADKASTFLESIVDLLHFKKEQAIYAMKWNQTRPRPIRGARGRYLPRSPEMLKEDIEASMRMKIMKREGYRRG